MKNRTEFVKQTIQERYRSLREFAKEVGIPYTTIKSALQKENGVDGMAVENALKIFHALGIDINGVSKDLDYQEEKLIQKFRKLNYFDKETVELMMDRLIESYETVSATMQIPIYDLPASAGKGQFLDSDHFDLIDFPENKVPREATFAVRVDGDSMEPDYVDKSIVFVKRTKDLLPGDIGIFTLNGEGFIKELGESSNLISHNKNYKDITIGEYDDLRVVGKVVGEPYIEEKR